MPWRKRLRMLPSSNSGCQVCGHLQDRHKRARVPFELLDEDGGYNCGAAASGFRPFPIQRMPCEPDPAYKTPVVPTPGYDRFPNPPFSNPTPWPSAPENPFWNRPGLAYPHSNSPGPCYNISAPVYDPYRNSAPYCNNLDPSNNLPAAANGPYVNSAPGVGCPPVVPSPYLHTPVLAYPYVSAPAVGCPPVAPSPYLYTPVVAYPYASAPAVSSRCNNTPTVAEPVDNTPAAANPATKTRALDMAEFKKPRPAACRTCLALFRKVPADGMDGYPTRSEFAAVLCETKRTMILRSEDQARKRLELTEKLAWLAMKEKKRIGPCRRFAAAG